MQYKNRKTFSIYLCDILKTSLYNACISVIDTCNCSWQILVVTQHVCCKLFSFLYNITNNVNLQTYYNILCINCISLIVTAACLAKLPQSHDALGYALRGISRYESNIAMLPSETILRHCMSVHIPVRTIVDTCRSRSIYVANLLILSIYTI